MLNKASGFAACLVGTFMILMGIHMMGHDTESVWWFISDVAMVFIGFGDIAVGYYLFTED